MKCPQIIRGSYLLTVFDQIEMQTKAMARPRQSKSISRQDSAISSARAGSPSNASAYSDIMALNYSKSRVSSDSSASNTHSASSAAAQPSIPRNSLEKPRTKKMFTRASIDKEGSQASFAEASTPHKRSGSMFSEVHKVAFSLDDSSKAESVDTVRN